MKPVTQTIGGCEGNCFAACLASILELPIEEVPHFCADYSESDWLLATQAWLANRKLGLVSMSFDDEADIRKAIRTGCLPFDAWYIVLGQTKAGFWHGCIGRGGRVVWDPNPGSENNQASPFSKDQSLYLVFLVLR